MSAKMLTAVCGRLSSLLLVLPLTACFSNGPSESEAREALRPVITSSYRTLCSSGRCQKSLDDVLKSFKLISCKEAAGQPGYRCDISWTDTVSTKNHNCRFVKTDDRWSCQLGMQ